MTKIQTVPRAKFLNEILFDNNVLDSNDGTKFNGTATNLTYSNSDIGYVYKQGVFGATTSVTLASTVNGVLGFSLWILPTANTKTIFSYTGGSVTITSGTLLASTGLTSPTYYVNGVNTTTLLLNVAQHVVITCSSINVAALNIGASSYTGNMGLWRMLSVSPNPQEIDTLYKEGQKKLGGSSYSGLMDGIVTYYDMNGDANDIVGSNNGTVTGATLTTDRFGNSNRAYSFNGTTGKIDLGASTSIKPASGVVITVGMWVKTSQVPAVYGMLWNGGYQNGAAANSSGFIGLNNAGTITLTGNGTDTVTSASTINNGAYRHLVCVVRSTGAKIYIDGALSASGNISLNAGYSTNNSGIGALNIDNLYFLNGIVDLNQISNREPSASEVLALYQESRKRYMMPF